MSVVPLLSLENIGFDYGAAPVLEDVSLTAEAGCLTFIIGRNGCGKSTLLKLAAGILRPEAGTVRLDGRPLASLRRRELARSLAYVPQRFSADFPFAAHEVVMQGRHPYLGLLGSETGEDRRLATSALKELGIAHLAERSVMTLSGGELQLVQVAAALVQTPRVLLLDEPTASLDPAHVLVLYERLRARVAAGLSAIVVSHELNHAAAFADRVIALAGSVTCATGTVAEVIRPDVLEQVYGVHLHVETSASSGRPNVRFVP